MNEIILGILLIIQPLSAAANDCAAEWAKISPSLGSQGGFVSQKDNPVCGFASALNSRLCLAKKQGKTTPSALELASQLKLEADAAGIKIEEGIETEQWLELVKRANPGAKVSIALAYAIGETSVKQQDLGRANLIIKNTHQTKILHLGLADGTGTEHLVVLENTIEGADGQLLLQLRDSLNPEHTIEAVYTRQEVLTIGGRQIGYQCPVIKPKEPLGGTMGELGISAVITIDADADK